MMKMNYNKTIAILSLAGIMLFPFAGLAQEENNGEQPLELTLEPIAVENVFCDKFSAWTEKVKNRIVENDAKLENWRAQNLNKRMERLTAQDGKSEQNRKRWDENRTNHFSKLEEKAQTDEQRQALIKFQESVNAAVSARRASMDAAKSAFREGISAKLQARKSKTDEVISAYRNGIDGIIEKINADCDTGADQKELRTTGMSALKNAKTKFQSDRKAIEKVNVSLETLLSTRKKAMEKAQADFKSALEKAKEELKSVWPAEKPAEESVE
ncbi:hypothetical protein KKC32_05295 [Patescibacteria group bacterium]|nr:hypothetical protein [Patescibacteria group bacterium]